MCCIGCCLCGDFAGRGLVSGFSLGYKRAMQQPKNVTPPQDAATAFLREVDEALHQERLLNLWHKSKWFVLAGVIALVLGVAGKEAWQAWSLHKARTLAAQWYTYSELKTDAEREKFLPSLLNNTSGGTKALAIYAEANMQHDAQAKADVYMKLVNDGRQPSWMRDVARLNAALSLLDAKPAEAKAQLEILSQTTYTDIPGPAYAPALELLALLAQQAGDVASAKGYTMKLLQTPGLPADLRQRALQRIGVLGGMAPNQTL